MSNFGSKVRQFLDRNVVLIASGALIVSTHYFWAKLQNSPMARDGHQPPKELPPILLAKFVYRKALEKYSNLVKPNKADEKSPAP